MVIGSNFPVLYDFIMHDAWQKRSEKNQKLTASYHDAFFSPCSFCTLPP